MYHAEARLHSTLVRFMGKTACNHSYGRLFTFHSGKIHGLEQDIEANLIHEFTFHSGKIHGRFLDNFT